MLNCSLSSSMERPQKKNYFLLSLALIKEREAVPCFDPCWNHLTPLGKPSWVVAFGRRVSWIGGDWALGSAGLCWTTPTGWRPGGNSSFIEEWVVGSSWSSGGYVWRLYSTFCFVPPALSLKWKLTQHSFHSFRWFILSLLSCYNV